MKFKVIKSKVDESFDVFTEDGGASYHYHNGNNWVSNYYVGRLTNLTGREDEWWIELQDAGMHVHDWDEDTDEDEIVRAALDWLVFPAPAIWVQDDKLFKHLIK
jgi:hypothetical protein